MPYVKMDTDLDNQELGVISNVGFGLRDVDYPVLWFTVDGLGTGSLQILAGGEIENFIVDNAIGDIKNLEGKVVVVAVNKGIVYVVRMFN